MVAWTTPRTWTNNETVTDTILNAHVRDNFNAIANPPYVYVRAGSVQTTLGNATPTPIQFDTELADTDSMYNPASPTKVTVNTAGLYLVQGGYGVSAAAINAIFYLHFMVSSTSSVISQAGSSVCVGGLSRSIMLHNSAYIRLYANDYVSLAGDHAGASSPQTSIAAASTGNYLAWMQLRWMGP